MKHSFVVGDRVKARAFSKHAGRLGVIIEIDDDKYTSCKVRLDNGDTEDISHYDLVKTFWHKTIKVDEIYWIHPQDHMGVRQKFSPPRLHPTTGEQIARLMKGKEQIAMLNMSDNTLLNVFIPDNQLEQSAMGLAAIDPSINLMRLITKMQQSLRAVPVDNGFIAPVYVPSLNSGTVGKYNLFSDLFFVVHLKRNMVETTSNDLIDLNSSMCLAISLKDKKGYTVAEMGRRSQN
jgi:hypothetical protein